jgi:predicted phage terminase large subunit-like protein
VSLDDDGLAGLAAAGSPALLGAVIEPGYRLYAHTRLLSEKARQLVTGESPRQVWSCEPQAGKSSLGSRLLPLWCLDNDPTLRLVIASYSAALAHGHSRWIRDRLLDRPDVLRARLSPTSRAAHRWSTTEGGGLLAVGVGGGLTGWSADLAIVDDAHAGWDDAHSEPEQERVHAWFRSVLRTRLQRGGRILVIGTRWSDGDLIGRLLAEDAEGRGEGWDVTRLPAIADHDPAQGETDPLGREPGEALCEELHSAAEVTQAMQAMPAHMRAAVYQQRPTPKEGSMFRPESWRDWDDEPAPTRSAFVGLVRAWDLAASEGRGDYTVGALIGRLRDGRTVVVDVVRGRWGPAQVQYEMRAAALWDRRRFGRIVATRFEQEPGSAGVVLRDLILEETLAGIGGVKAVAASGSKERRATPLAAAVADGQVWLAPVLEPETGRDGAWVDALVAEAAAFPDGGHDDIVDALSLGYNELRTACTVARPVRLTSSAGATLVDGVSW